MTRVLALGHVAEDREIALFHVTEEGGLLCDIAVATGLENARQLAGRQAIDGRRAPGGWHRCHQASLRRAQRLRRMGDRIGR